MSFPQGKKGKPRERPDHAPSITGQFKEPKQGEVLRIGGPQPGDSFLGIGGGHLGIKQACAPQTKCGEPHEASFQGGIGGNENPNSF